MSAQKKVLKFKHPYEAAPVRIVSDAMIATGIVGEGRFVPLLIVDGEQRPDIAEMIRIHVELSVGDFTCQWGQPPKRDGTIALILQFIRPAELTAILAFDIEKQGGVVDTIIGARALYLQAGKEGDRLMNTMEQPKILIEIGDLGFDKEWDKMLRKHTAKRLRKEGLSRAEAKRAVEGFLKEWRRMTGFRMPR
jgi:hypothetical protein